MEKSRTHRRGYLFQIVIGEVEVSNGDGESADDSEVVEGHVQVGQPNKHIFVLSKSGEWEVGYVGVVVRG